MIKSTTYFSSGRKKLKLGLIADVKDTKVCKMIVRLLMIRDVAG